MVLFGNGIMRSGVTVEVSGVVTDVNGVVTAGGGGGVTVPVGVVVAVMVAVVVGDAVEVTGVVDVTFAVLVGVAVVVKAVVFVGATVSVNSTVMVGGGVVVVTVSQLNSSLYSKWAPALSVSGIARTRISPSALPKKVPASSCTAVVAGIVAATPNNSSVSTA